MHDDSSFLVAIAADRENDDLRLVYADWFEEHDDARCEYLRAMCELIAMPPVKTPERQRLLDAVDEYHTLYGWEWAYSVARRFDVILHTVDRPALLRRLLLAVQEITGLNEFNALDLVRGLPNTGRFRTNPRRIIQVNEWERAYDIAARLRLLGTTISIVPATELVERANLGLGVRHSPYQRLP
jgi:uncharacterized protein (TIGR02996 family)